MSETIDTDYCLFDKRGIPIERGDLVKVFHFTSNRKRHYMYKQCLGFKKIGQAAVPYMMFSHLNFIEDSTKTDGPYLERPDGRVLSDYEIIQSIDYSHERRPRVRPTPKVEAHE